MLELPEYKEIFMLCPEFEWKWYRWHRYFQMFQSVCPLADVCVQFYLNSTRVALHDSRLKILSILCLKQAFFSASPFRLASFVLAAPLKQSELFAWDQRVKSWKETHELNIYSSLKAELLLYKDYLYTLWLHYLKLFNMSIHQCRNIYIIDK